ncbi:MAG: hypothetical protein QXE45_04700 [Thermoplasmata archaeon]
MEVDAMSLVVRKSFLVIVIWIVATLVFAVALATIESPRMFLGLPWIVYLSVIAQVSILALFFVISKRIWKTEEGDR